MRTVEGKLIGTGMSVAIVVSRFNELVSSKLLEGAKDALLRHDVSHNAREVYWVPGAWELPLICKELALSGKYDAIIALGAVIRGATPHADLINSQVSKSLAQVAIARGVPVINAVICADSIEQAVERAGTKAGNKGWDGAQAAMEMATLWKKLQ